MSHFAKVLDGKVKQVIVAEPEFFNTFVDSSAGQWIQTSYNTLANVHTQGGSPLRGNYAGIGFIYDSVDDVFYAPQPYASWILNKDIWTWEAPVAVPVDDKFYNWDEATLNWIEVTV
jgi:hypothetical protein